MRELETALEQERTRTRDLLAETRDLVLQRSDLQRRVAQQGEALAASRQNLRKARTRPTTGGEDPSRWFLDPEEQFRFEVQLAWARRIPAAQKAELPLRDYGIGPDFLDSVERVQGIKRSKVVDVVVEIVTGLAETTLGRELHPLRETAAGGSTQRFRADGAKAWRASLQVNAASARRLHFWRLRDNTIELAAVAVHDDIAV